MKNKILLVIIIGFIFLSPLMAQEDVQIGSLKYQQRGLSGFFDFSDPSGINIKVQVWGYVRFPGYYIIPARSGINELISIAGGPDEKALLDEIRIIRTLPDSSTIMYKYNYDDLLWGENLSAPIKFPRIYAGDMLIIPGEERYTSRDDLTLIFYITSTIALVTSAIYGIFK